MTYNKDTIEFLPLPTHARFRNLTGQVFGRLTALGVTGHTKRRKVVWGCRCECGAFCIVGSSELLSGHTKSCGCFRSQFMRETHLSHGKTLTPTHAAWRNLRERCNNPNNKRYKDYGGRGIAVCSRWDSFENFLEDMGERPSRRHTIERIDNDKGYSPDNCKWATFKEQARNRRSTLRVTYRGQTKPLVEWCEELNVKYKLVYQRLRQGWDVEKSLHLKSS